MASLRRGFSVLLVGWFALTIAPATSADPIDVALLKLAPDLMRHAKDAGVKNLGVLRFRVRVGDGPDRFDSGPLNDSLVLRLEEALIRVNDETHPIGITHDATAHARQRFPNASYLDPAGRAQLFQVRYPPAWGTDRVAVDAFVTGRLVVSVEGRATLAIEWLPKADAAPTVWREVQVPMTRAMLAEAGLVFAARGQAALQSRGLDDELDGIAVLAKAKKKPAKSEPTGTPTKAAEKPRGATPPAAEPATPKIITVADQPTAELVEMTIFVDGKPAKPTTDAENPEWLMIPEPQPGQTLHITLKNRHSARVGVVLRVNGVNTLYKEADEREISRFSKWILEPGKTYQIRGFHRDTQTLEPFAITSKSADAATAFGPLAQRGLIQCDVFAERQQAPRLDVESTRALLTMRGLAMSEVTDPPAKDLAELKARLRKASGKPLTDRGFIVGGSDQRSDLKEATITHPFLVESTTIRYARVGQ